LWRRKEVGRANVKMSHKLTVFLRLPIINSLKKHTIFITATLLKYRECREFHFAFYVIITLLQDQSQKPPSSTLTTHAAFIEQW
jgi:hypothetical protein